jgi:hypothetical protein
MLKFILSALMNSGVGDHFDGGTGGDLGSLTSALKAEKDKNKGENQLSRLQDAFKQLKDMHKDDKPFDFESAHWPYGPIGAPSQAQASVPMPMARPPEAAAVPMPMARPADAPQAPSSSPFADFFKRNTALMKDQQSGEYIDPTAAHKALFG